MPKSTYIITITKTGLMYEVEAENKVKAMEQIWKEHYLCWDFTEFCKKATIEST